MAASSSIIFVTRRGPPPSPYSPRARAAASVAWPCRWNELTQHQAADAMTIPRAQEALQTHTDPWAGTEPQSLSAAALRAAAAR